MTGASAEMREVIPRMNVILLQGNHTNGGVDQAAARRSIYSLERTIALG